MNALPSLATLALASAAPTRGAAYAADGAAGDAGADCGDFADALELAREPRAKAKAGARNPTRADALLRAEAVGGARRPDAHAAPPIEPAAPPKDATPDRTGLPVDGADPQDPPAPDLGALLPGWAVVPVAMPHTPALPTAGVGVAATPGPALAREDGEVKVEGVSGSSAELGIDRSVAKPSDQPAIDATSGGRDRGPTPATQTSQTAQMTPVTPVTPTTPTTQVTPVTPATQTSQTTPLTPVKPEATARPAARSSAPTPGVESRPATRDAPNLPSVSVPTAEPSPPTAPVGPMAPTAPTPAHSNAAPTAAPDQSQPAAPAGSAAASLPMAPPAAASMAAPAQVSAGSTTPAPFEARLNAPLDSPTFAPALASQISWLVNDGVQHARLSLNPLEMGPVMVKIVLDGNQARIDFSADLAATRAAIETSLPTLAAALHDNGLTLAGGGVFDGQPRQGTPEGRAAQPQGHAAHAKAPIIDPASLPAAAPRSTRGLIDLVA